MLLVTVSPQWACGGSARSRHSGAPLRTITGRATVVDGDGLEIDGKEIRLFGIDAPEVQQYCVRRDSTRWHCGQYATVALDRLVAGHEVACSVRDQDGYGRSIASCTVEGRDLAAEQVREGWAVAYRKYSDDYADEEGAAKDHRAGIWAGRFEQPWLWRERERRRDHPDGDTARRRG